MNRWYAFAGGAAIVLVMTAACMRVGPAYQKPDIGVPIPDRYTQAGLPATAATVPDRWWTDFADPVLNNLVEQALSYNWDIKRAAARILEVESAVTQSRSARFPALKIQAQGTRQRISAVSSFGPRETKGYSLSFPATFELDLWERLASEEKSARARLVEAVENRRTLLQSVVAQTVTFYLQIQALQRRTRIASSMVESYRRTLAVVENRYRQGLNGVLDVKQARRGLAQAEALVPELQRDLGAVQHKLSVLLGRYPQSRPAQGQPQDHTRHLVPVPPGLPSELLLRRPDIRAAEARLRALNAQVAAAKAARFPQVTLTGSLGYSSEALGALFTPESRLWSLALGLVQPLFDAGRRQAAQSAAEARYRQGISDYAKTVLNAFAEVEQALLARKVLWERRESLQRLFAEARSACTVAQERYRRGLTDYLSVLTLEQRCLKAEQDVVLADLAVLTNRVTLYRALGGGWREPGVVSRQNEDQR
ncbi:MAG: efflux transporter outer membrane subunit [Deltaproteobacteria bacterium]|nr:efflux transporter outer membrane subunit [Deltaproteobacteria bacterium]